MSTKYPGGFITKSPVAPTSTAASGVWTLDQQQQYQKAGTWPAPPIFIEDIFSTYLYTGNGTGQTITNGIDFSGNGGLLWIKNRGAAVNHVLYDTVRGAEKVLYSNNTLAEGTDLAGYQLGSFASTGFVLDQDNGGNAINASSNNYVSWSFREQAKFFDVVTYTGDGTGGQTISHNLGSAPGCVIVKRLNANADWCVWHRGSGGNTDVTEFSINTTTQALRSPAGYESFFTSTTFRPYWVIGTDGNNGNISGGTYVAYLFAHNAGGFPASGSGSTNGISCGSYTGNGSSTGPTVTLGYEPQWVMIKAASTTSDWSMFDNMRGLAVGGEDRRLWANLSNEEQTGGNYIDVTATGFYPSTTVSTINGSGQTYIYIAIRRGPMKVPTDATKVFVPVSQTGGGTVTTNFPVDLVMGRIKSSVASTIDVDRLRGSSQYVFTNTTAAEANNGSPLFGFNDSNVGYVDYQFASGVTPIYWNFRRAPSFFDEVCWTGTTSEGTPINVSHNLGVVPELIITKKRSQGASWFTYHSALTAANYVSLNSDGASAAYANMWNNTTPTSTVFTTAYQNASGDTYVAYLFATCAGVSKVGSYTGTGATQTISCGFTGGARFVLIKRTDSTGDWFVWDTARGMVSGTDPSLSLNSTAAEVNANSIYTTTGGFQIVSTAAGINASGGTYIFLAIA